VINLKKESTILITGSSGLVGNSLVNKLTSKGYKKILTPSSKELDLRNQNQVENYFKNNKIDYVFHLAAKIGGYKGKIDYPAEFIYDNLIMACNIVESSKKHNIKRLIFIGSSTIYSNEGHQPFKEESLLLGKLEPINEGYALAKTMGLKLCEYYNRQYNTNFIGLVVCNIYGPNDNFGSNPHVIASLIEKFYSAKKNNLSFVQINSSGKIKREFIFVEDLVEAMLYFIEHANTKELKTFVNIGYSKDVSIKDLALLIKEVVGYPGEIKFDELREEDMPKRLLDIRKANKLGWAPKTSIKEGIKLTYDWFLKNKCGK
tara:strand:+ start:6214 stop:7164 length:951 start_codon:yes stop_codon:yes gene_type:complete